VQKKKKSAAFCLHFFFASLPLAYFATFYCRCKLRTSKTMACCLNCFGLSEAQVVPPMLATPGSTAFAPGELGMKGGALGGPTLLPGSMIQPPMATAVVVHANGKAGIPPSTSEAAAAPPAY